MSHIIAYLSVLEARLHALQGWRRYVYGLGLFFLLTLPLYAYGVHQQFQMNQRITGSDQFGYLEYARELADSDFGYEGDGARMPLFPAIQALHYNPDESLRAFFIHSKQVSVALSILILLMVGVVFLGSFRPLIAFPLLAIGMFTLFVFKAAFVQAELLYYGLSLVGFVGMVRLLERPSWPVGLGTGIVLGLAHLTKASVLPGLGVFLIVYGVAFGVRVHKEYRKVRPFWRWRKVVPLRYWLRMARLWRRFRRKMATIPYPVPRHHIRRVKGGEMRWQTYVWSGGLMVTAFVILIAPMLMRHHHKFGHALYNVNTTFYMWYDSWGEVETGTKRYGDREGYPRMAEEDLPSLSKYLRTHSLGEIIVRPINGFLISAGKSCGLDSFGHCKYAVGYGVALFFLWNAARPWPQAERPRFALWFGVLYLGVYLASYSWFAPVVYGAPRFWAALFLPALYLIGKTLAAEPIATQRMRLSGEKLSRVEWLQWGMVGVIGLDILVLLTAQIMRFGGGG